jgi:hypothetical protein
MERHYHFINYTTLNWWVNRSILWLLYTLVRDSMIGNYPCTIVLEWYKQKQELCDLGWFLPRANTIIEQRTQLMQVEALVSRYVMNLGTIIVFAYPRMLFSIPSMSNATVWYIVSIQSNYCDCLNTKCNHIIGVILLIERKYAWTSDSLPIIITLPKSLS